MGPHTPPSTGSEMATGCREARAPPHHCNSTLDPKGQVHCHPTQDGCVVWGNRPLRIIPDILGGSYLKLRNWRGTTASLRCQYLGDPDAVIAGSSKVWQLQQSCGIHSTPEQHPRRWRRVSWGEVPGASLCSAQRGLRAKNYQDCHVLRNGVPGSEKGIWKGRAPRKQNV